MTEKVMTKEKTDLKFYEAMVAMEVVPYFEGKLREKRESIQSVYTSEGVFKTLEDGTEVKYYVIAAKEGIIDEKNQITKEEYDKNLELFDLKEFDLIGEVKTLRELLEKDGFDSGNDTAVIVSDGCGVMHVSHRYLCCEPWKDLLNGKAIRICKGNYETIKEEN